MQRIVQFRLNFLADAQEEYDCSFAEGVDCSTRGPTHPFFGYFCIFFFIATVPLYFLCARVVWTLRKLSCYKIMFVLAVSDICALSACAFVFGIFLIQGELYCNHPKMHFVHASFSMFTFVYSCVACLLLALNRMFELMIPTWYDVIFRDSRLFLLYPVFCHCTFPFSPLSSFFNANYHLIIVNPVIGNERYEYYSMFQFLTTALMPCLSFLVYFSMLKTKYGILRTADMSKQGGDRVYQVTQFIPPTDAFLYFAQIGWMLIHGSPPLVYIFFNQSVREGIVRFVVPARVTVSYLNTTTNKQGSVVT
ncbi:hypothetical protein PRIPAC_80142, partial [Pristionchus pacificus]|uniref:G protein-coupled receptor n=1 Tax=Pristionchus pacificus TaxID=54126 RepID=A0A2A6CLR3_PRIPA